jgi:hypothetical protein
LKRPSLQHQPCSISRAPFFVFTAGGSTLRPVCAVVLRSQRASRQNPRLHSTIRLSAGCTAARRIHSPLAPLGQGFKVPDTLHFSRVASRQDIVTRLATVDSQSCTPGRVSEAQQHQGIQPEPGRTAKFTCKIPRPLSTLFGFSVPNQHPTLHIAEANTSLPSKAKQPEGALSPRSWYHSLVR